MAVITCAHCGVEVEVADLASIRTGHEVASRKPRQWVITVGGAAVHRCDDRATRRRGTSPYRRPPRSRRR